jgi:uncharacterized membrane protein
MRNPPLENLSSGIATNRKPRVVIQIVTLLLLWIAWGVIVSLNPKQWKEITTLVLIMTAIAALNMIAERRDDGVIPDSRCRADDTSKRKPAEQGARANDLRRHVSCYRTFFRNEAAEAKS